MCNRGSFLGYHFQTGDKMPYSDPDKKLEYHKNYNREYEKRPEVKAKRLAARQTPEYKAKRAEYYNKLSQTEEFKARRAKYYEKYKIVNVDKIDAYENSPDRLASKKASKSTPEYKERERAKKKAEYPLKKKKLKISKWRRVHKIVFLSEDEANEWYEKSAATIKICDICEIPADKLVLDHNHQTGRPRGLVCNLCNMQLLSTLDRLGYDKLLEVLNKIRGVYK